MSSIDRRVVEMEFDNKQFEAGIRDTLDSLEALKKGLQLGESTKGIKGLEDIGTRSGLGGMADALDNISSKFSAMGAIGFAVIQRLTNAAIDFAKNIAGKLLDPLVSGGRRRALNIEQAKFQFQGLGMDIEATMASALEAVRGTAFGLDEAAKAAGQFGASGMQAGDEMTSALRAISGVAAMTSSSYDDIANVFTKVAGNGRVMGDDLLRMSSRGLNAAATLAKSLGISEAEVRQLVTEGQISFEMFYKAMDEAFGENATKANETYTGSLANMRAALSRIGANFFTPWLQQQRDLFNALSPAIDSVGNALKPVITLLTRFTGNKTRDLISAINSFDFDSLYLIISPLSAILRNIVNAVMAIVRPIRDAFFQIFPPKSIEEINSILKAIQKFTAGIKIGADSSENLRRTFAGVFAVFSIGVTVLKAFGNFLVDIFRQFSDGSGGFLASTANIGDFLVALDQALKNGDEIGQFFKGFARVLERPIELLKQLTRAIRNVFDFEAPSPDEITLSLEPLTRLGRAIATIWGLVWDRLDRVWSFFKLIAERLSPFFERLGSAITNTFGDLEFGDIIDVIQTGLLGGILATFSRFVKNMGSGMNSAIGKLTMPFQKITFTLNTMQNTLRAMTLMQIAIAIGILTLSVVALSKVDNEGLAKALAAITAMMVQLVGVMAAIGRLGGTTGLVAIGAGLFLFATALRILVSSVKALADMSWRELERGLVGVSALIGALVVAVQAMSGHTKGMFTAGAGLLVLAFGIKILVGAVTDLAGLSWEELGRGLTGVGALIASLAIFTRLASLDKMGLTKGAGILLLALGIKILADAASDFAAMSWEEIAKGLTSIGALLLAFSIFSRILDPSGIVRTGIALVLVGAAMKILASALSDFGSMSWEEIGKGLLTMAGALVAIVLALNLMPPSTIVSAGALVAVAYAMGLMADALGQMGGMSWAEIGRGLTTLAGSLIIIAVAMIAMQGAMAGALATFVVASALRILAPVLQTFGSMSLREIATGLGTLAAVFLVLGAAGLVLAPIIPALVGLGVAVALIGGGLMLAGAGLLLFSIGLTALAAAGAAGTAAIVGMIAGIASLFPLVFQQFGFAIIILAETLAGAGPIFMDALSVVVQAIVGAIRENSPDIIDTFGDMVNQLLDKMVELVPKMASTALDIMIAILKELNAKVPTIVQGVTRLVVSMLREMTKSVPRFVTAATDLLVAFLRGVQNNLGKVITAGADIIIELIKGISRNSVRIVEAGMDAVLDFIKGITSAINKRSAEFRQAGRDLALAIVDGMTGGLGSAVSRVASSARDLASNALKSAKNVLGIRSPSREFSKIGIFIGEGLAIGMENATATVGRAGESVGNAALNSVKDSLAGLSDILDVDADMNPTITPVLDLSQFRKDVAQMDTAMPGNQLDIEVAYSKAKDASSRYQANAAAQHATTTADEVTPPAEITYNQYNNSPKALSSAEIYRQTKNQLSVAKGALTPNAT